MTKLTLGQIAFIQGMTGMKLDLEGKELSDELEIIAEVNEVEATETSHLKEYINGVLTTLSARGLYLELYSRTEVLDSLEKNRDWFYTGLEDGQAPKKDMPKDEWKAANMAFVLGRSVATNALWSPEYMEKMESVRPVLDEHLPYKEPILLWDTEGVKTKAEIIDDIEDIQPGILYLKMSNPS